MLSFREVGDLLWYLYVPGPEERAHIRYGHPARVDAAAHLASTHTIAPSHLHGASQALRA
jgi:hypothetical protein